MRGIELTGRQVVRVIAGQEAAQAANCKKVRRVEISLALGCFLVVIYSLYRVGVILTHIGG